MPPKVAAKAKAKARAVPRNIRGVPQLLRDIERGDRFNINAPQYSNATIEQIVDFLMSCTFDVKSYWLGVIYVLRPNLLISVTTVYADRAANERLRVSVLVRTNRPLAVMPNGVVRARPRPPYL